MEFGKAGWLAALLQEVVSSHRPGRIPDLLDEALKAASGRARARAYLRHLLRETGLLYGTPATGEVIAQSVPPEVVLFLAVVRIFGTVALEIADRAGPPAKPSPAHLLSLFAALTGLVDEAEEIARKAASGVAPAKRTWGKVESALEKRSMSLGGDPAYGLVLHNGAVYSDALVFGHHAIELFSRGELRRAPVLRRNELGSRQKALLVEVLTALTRAEHAPSYPVRRAILRQIEDLQLPSQVEDGLRSRVKQIFARPPNLPTAVREVRSADMRRFILEQTLLASLVDGHRSPEELEFIQALAKALSVPTEELARIELAMAEFYAKNRSVVDVFTVTAGAEAMGEEAVATMQRIVEKNYSALLKEIRETGELSVLLTRAARGQKLTAEERGKMRAQLIDIAKAIPALAIFAAPGGLLLLIALAKVLPFNLLPSAFQEEFPADAEPAPVRERAGGQR